MSIHVVLSNSAAELANRLAKDLNARQSDPLQTPWILIQAPGMERFLNLSLAAHNGVSFGNRCLFPNKLLQALLANQGEARFPFDKEAARLVLQEILRDSDAGATPIPSTLQAYLTASEAGKRSDQLAGALAELLDQYTVHRPDWLELWTGSGAAPAGHDSDEWRWQADVWRRLIAKAPEFDIGALVRRRFPASGPVDAELEFGETLYGFAVSYLPELYIGVLECIAKRKEVRLYTLAPGPLAAGSQIPLFGHRLRQFLRRMEAGGQCRFEFMPAKPSPLWPLHQRLARAEGFQLEAGAPSALEPGRVELHSAHSPMREAEALHLWLLHRFRDDPSLRASDVLIIAPELTRYAPAVAAAFRESDSATESIPLSIADASAPAEASEIELCLNLLLLPVEKYRARAMLAVLQSPPIIARHGYSYEDPAMLVDTAVIRRGRDRDAEAGEIGQRGGVAHPSSWREGLDRLLQCWALDQALPGDQRRIDAERGRIFGRVALAASEILEFCRHFETPPAPEQWPALLRVLARQFLTPGGETAAAVNEAADWLRSLIDRFELRAPLAAGSIAAFLQRRVAARSPGRGFLRGGATISAMMPMRNVPFRIVCLLGMNEGEFPRQHSERAINLLSRHPRPGDPSRRLEDRLVFLEALLAARDWLYISHSGQDAGGLSAPAPPAYPVQELSRLLDGLVEIRHPLTAWDPRYFQAAKQRGALPGEVSPARLEAARAMQQGARSEPTNWTPLYCFENENPVQTRWQFDELVRALQNPAQTWLRSLRIGLCSLDRDRTESVDEFETWAATDEAPAAANALLQYQLRERSLYALLEGRKAAELLAEIAADPRLPAGSLGQALAAQAISEAAVLVKATGAKLRTETLSFCRDVDGQTIHGTARLHRTGKTYLRLSAGRLNARRRLEAALLFAALQIEGDCLMFNKESEALRLFTDGKKGDPLLKLALRLASETNRRFVPFFPESAYTYYSERSAGKTEKQALFVAQARFQPAHNGPFSESADPALRFLLGEDDIFDPSTGLLDEFREIAMQLWSAVDAVMIEVDDGE